MMTVWQEHVHYLDTQWKHLYYILRRQNRLKELRCHVGHIQMQRRTNRLKKNRTTKDKEDPATMSFHSTYSHFNPHLNLASLHQDKTERKQSEKRQENGEREQTVERHFLNWVGQSDQEGAIECMRVRERKKEGNRDRGGEGGGGAEEEEVVGDWLCTIGLDMNAPRHSFPHIPFNFNSLIELATLCTHSHCA